MTLKLILEEDGNVVEETTVAEATGEERDVSVSDVKKKLAIWVKLTRTLLEKLYEEDFEDEYGWKLHWRRRKNEEEENG